MERHSLISTVALPTFESRMQGSFTGLGNGDLDFFSYATEVSKDWESEQ